jgi:DNA-binding CsgD family transcriptional regulator
VSTERLLELVGDVSGVLELEQFHRAMLLALARAIRSNWVSVNDIHPDPSKIVALVEPDIPEHLHAAFAEHAHENPLIQRHLRTRDGRARRMSEVVTTAQLHALALYREVYAPLGVEYQLACVLDASPDHFVGIALARRDRDFTLADCNLLERARPFLVQACRNAKAYTALSEQLAVREEPRAALESALRDAGVGERESEVLACVALGRSNRDAGELLGISPRTVQAHLRSGFRKLEVGTRSQAAARTWELVTKGFVT